MDIERDFSKICSAYVCAESGAFRQMSVARWLSRLWIVRHGESAGNVALDEAHARGAERIDLTTRDVDITLSALGEEQARTLGARFDRETSWPE